ncbi:ATP-dependent DNA helicase, partial [Nephila pilipes]
MPTKRKGANLSRDTNKSRSIRNRRAQRTEEEVQEENTGARVRMAQLRQDDTRAERNEVMRLEQRQSYRFTVNRRRVNDQQRQQAHRAFVATSFRRLAFQYEPDIEYYAHSKVVIGAMDKECPRIVSELDALLNEHNELLKIFKSHMHKLESNNHAIVINPDKTPAGEHIRRFNAPVADDVAGIMVGDRTGAREIVILRRNNNLQFIADTHRSYDALQYPLIFWKGQDGYSINIKQRDPVS